MQASIIGGAQVRFFFFQAEDGIRDVAVTGVQTCALPIGQPRDRLGAAPIAWLTEPRLAMAAVVLMTVWWTLGFNFVLYLAGLQDIPRELRSEERRGGKEGRSRGAPDH